MQLWQYREWNSGNRPAVRQKVDVLLDALEVTLEIAHRRGVLPKRVEDVIDRLYVFDRLFRDQPHVWVVVAAHREGAAKVLGVVLTEEAAAELAATWRVEALAGKCGAYGMGETIELMTDGGEPGRTPWDVFVSWDEHTVEVGPEAAGLPEEVK
jgi:hypothetical protein